jgi:hypothetical protein
MSRRRRRPALGTYSLDSPTSSGGALAGDACDPGADGVGPGLEGADLDEVEAAVLDGGEGAAVGVAAIGEEAPDRGGSVLDEGQVAEAARTCSRNRISPPGTSTRATSAMAFWLSATLHRSRVETTVSNEALGKGRSSTPATTTFGVRASLAALHSRRRSMCGLRSATVSLTPGR